MPTSSSSICQGYSVKQCLQHEDAFGVLQGTTWARWVLACRPASGSVFCASGSKKHGLVNSCAALRTPNTVSVSALRVDVGRHCRTCMALTITAMPGIT